MEKIHPDLKGHFERNEEMWGVWQAHGINEETPINVDFHFECPSYEKGLELKSLLEERGLDVKLVKEKKFFFFTKGLIEVTMPTQTWTLEKVQECTEMYFKIASLKGCELDGLGAYMP